MEELVRSLALFGPEIAVVAGLLLVVVVDSIGAAWRNAAMRALTLASLAVALGLAFNLQSAGAKGALFSGMLVVDPLGTAFKLILIGAGLLTVLAFTFRNSRELHGLGQGELFALVLSLVLSSMLLAAAGDIVMLFLAIFPIFTLMRRAAFETGRWAESDHAPVSSGDSSDGDD